MTTSQQSRLGDAPEEGIKSPVVTISSGNETLFGIGQTIASVVIQDRDRVAVAAQTDSTENGIYVARGGNPWERATDMNLGEDVVNGQLVTDSETLAVYSITSDVTPWRPGVDTISFGLLLSPVGFFWGAITGTLSNQADLQIELDAKADLVHTHVEADITDLQAYILDAPVDGQLYGREDAAWVVIDFSIFAPTVHTHLEADILDLKAYLTDAQGSLDNDDQLFARANNGWQAFTTASGTVGEIIAWPEDDPPENFLTCDGSLQNAVTFADLFAVLGFKYGGGGANFNLPDLRGQFIRGRAGGSGNDPDRTSRTDRGDGGVGDLVGTKQGDEFKSHQHGLPIYANNNAGPQAENADTSGGLHTAFSFSAGGSETRPTNVYMNYIIRFTGGGSGITQPPTIEVQDNTVTLTTAAQLFNFEGFVLDNSVEPDEITIRFGASPNSALFCPGFTFDFISTNSWQIQGNDQTNLFTQGRRLQFTDGALLYFGTIVSSVFSAGNTIMVMSMESGDVLTNTITEVCLTTSATSWSPIAEDPFSSTRINAITTGTVGADEYYVIVGNAGRLSFSKDGGLSWTAVTTGTSENLNDVGYNLDDESFLAVGNAGVYLFSTDGETWALDTTKIPAGPGTDNDNIRTCIYSPNGAGWGIMWVIDNSGGQRLAKARTLDETATWTFGAVAVSEVAFNAKMVTRNAVGGDAGQLIPFGQDVNGFTDATDMTSSSIVNHSGDTNVTAILSVVLFGIERIFNGHADTLISIYSATSFHDIQTFGTSSVRQFAYSRSLDTMVAVADDGKVGFYEGMDGGAIVAAGVNASVYTLAENGSNPLANFTGVVWNEADGLFVAVNDEGQILRSSNGKDTVPILTETGFTLIAADPFGGTLINRIMSGVIGPDVFWVAIGPTGRLFTSTDAGVTWTVRTTGTTENLISIAYNSSNSQFLVGCTNGAWLSSTDGTTWTLDTTTLPAEGGTGSKDILAVVWGPSAGTWWLLVSFNAGVTRRSFTIPSDLVTLTTRDTSIQAQPVIARISFSGTVVVFANDTDDLRYFPSVNNAADQIFDTFVDGGSCLGIGVAAGTGSFNNDWVIGKSNGFITRTSNLAAGGTTQIEPESVMTGAVNGVANSSVSSRWIAVGDSGEIYTLPVSQFSSGNWVEVINPFTGNITDVHYDPTDDIFIAVAANGEIGRSVDGIT